MAINIGDLQKSMQTECSAKTATGSTGSRKLSKEKRSLKKSVFIVVELSPLKISFRPHRLKAIQNFYDCQACMLARFLSSPHPRHISLGWSGPIIGLNKTFDVSMFLSTETGNCFETIAKKVGLFEAKIMGDADKGAPRDPMRRRPCETSRNCVMPLRKESNIFSICVLRDHLRKKP